MYLESRGLAANTINQQLAAAQRVDKSGPNHRRTNLPSRRSDRQTLGRRNLAECGLVRGEKSLREGRAAAHCAPRPPQNLCEAVPHKRRRDRTDSIPTRPCLGADYRTLSRLQAVAIKKGQSFGSETEATAENANNGQLDKISVNESSGDQERTDERAGTSIQGNGHVSV